MISSFTQLYLNEHILHNKSSMLYIASGVRNEEH